MLLPVLADDTVVDPLCLILSIKAINLKGKIVYCCKDDTSVLAVELVKA